MSCLNISVDRSILKTHLINWWKNPRQKDKGGFLLTDEGFSALTKANIKYYKIIFDENLNFENKIILGLDNFINYPFFITRKEIYVFDETTAIQMVLFGGNVKKFINAKLNNFKKS